MLSKKEKKISFLLTAIQFANVLDFVVMMPLAPLLLKYFSINMVQFGLLVSSYNISSGVVGLIAGCWLDYFERKKLLLVTFFLFILATLLCAIAGDFYALLIARILAGAFGGLVSSSSYAILGDSISPGAKGEATGIMMSSFSIASVLGVPLGLILATTYDWRASFYFIVLLGLGILFCAYKILPTIQPEKNQISVSEMFQRYLTLLKTKNLFYGVLLLVSVSFSSFIIIPFMSAYCVHNLHMDPQQLKYIYLFGGFFTFFSSRPVGKLCDSFGEKKVFDVIMIISIIPILIFTNLKTQNLGIVLFFSTMFMMFTSSRFIPVMTLVNSLSLAKDRGTYLSLANSMRTFTIAFAAYLAGHIVTQKKVVSTVATLAVSNNFTEYYIDGFWKTGIISVVMTIVSLIVIKKINFHRI